MRVIALLPLVVIGGIASSAFQTQDTKAFDLKDPKGVTGMSIAIDGMLEPVRGYASGITGNLSLNLKDPAKSTGKIIVDATTAALVSPAMTAAMRQPWCLDTAKYPTIEFDVTKVGEVKTLESGWMEAKVTGNFTFHGVTKPMTIEARVHHLPGKLKARGGVAKDGDLIQVASKFSFSRKDFDLAPDLSTDLIGDKINIDLAVTGVAFN